MTNFRLTFLKTQNKEQKKNSEFLKNILVLNILKYISLKEKVEKFFFKCPKIAAKSAAPILFTVPKYIAPTVHGVNTNKCELHYNSRQLHF
jgi:hypothetical protein